MEPRAGRLTICARVVHLCARTPLKVKTTTRFGKVFDALSQIHRLPRADIRIRFNGTDVTEDHTPAALGMSHDADVVVTVERSHERRSEEVVARGGLVIGVVSKSCDRVDYAVKPSTKFEKVFAAFCFQYKLEREDVTFVYGDAQISPDQTPSAFDMADLAIITAKMPGDEPEVRRSGRKRVERVERAPGPVPAKRKRKTKRHDDGSRSLESLSAVAWSKLYVTPPATTFDEAHYQERAARAAALHEALIDDPSDEEFPPDRILAVRMRFAEDGTFSGKYNLLVAWEGWSHQHATWVATSQFKRDRAMVQALTRELFAAHARYDHTQLATPEEYGAL